ncbi:MAG: flagellar protein FlgN [Desulfobulbaceae bacterium]|jgi:flagellar biosynthesis/type III secretory pathway chaperone|nr:flagellar protein FlgN [Desulfobulbaceae bacterium]
MAESTREHLERLLAVILAERQCAKNMDTAGMEEAMREKEHLLEMLSHVRRLDEADKPLAARIRHENRRNAYLFRSALGWIHDTLEFFGTRIVNSTYSERGKTVASEVHGRLLSGRI